VIKNYYTTDSAYPNVMLVKREANGGNNYPVTKTNLYVPPLNNRYFGYFK
jgi:hypothetical protein